MFSRAGVGRGEEGGEGGGVGCLGRRGGIVVSYVSGISGFPMGSKATLFKVFVQLAERDLCMCSAYMYMYAGGLQGPCKLRHVDRFVQGTTLDLRGIMLLRHTCGQVQRQSVPRKAPRVRAFDGLTILYRGVEPRAFSGYIQSILRSTASHLQ